MQEERGEGERACTATGVWHELMNYKNTEVILCPAKHTGGFERGMVGNVGCLCPSYSEDMVDSDWRWTDWTWVLAVKTKMGGGVFISLSTEDADKSRS